jgi:uncharacterized protein (DUF486 family)
MSMLYTYSLNKSTRLCLATLLSPYATLKTMKLVITIGIFVGGTVFGWLGSLLDHGNWLGGWSILLSGAGSILGIWIGYKAAKNFGL